MTILHFLYHKLWHRFGYLTWIHLSLTWWSVIKKNEFPKPFLIFFFSQSALLLWREFLSRWHEASVRLRLLLALPVPPLHADFHIPSSVVRIFEYSVFHLQRKPTSVARGQSRNNQRSEWSSSHVNWYAFFLHFRSYVSFRRHFYRYLI